MNVGFRRVNSKQEVNREALSSGVANVTCLHADAFEILIARDLFDAEQQQAIKFFFANMMTEAQYVGTVELYANRAINMFIKEHGRVVGYAIIRFGKEMEHASIQGPDNDSSA